MSLDQLHLLPPAQQEAILNGPAHAPPPGVTPNFEDPPNNNRLCVVFLSVAFFGCMYHIVSQVGFFVHQWDIRVRDLPVMFYDIHLASDFYVIAIVLYKAAILLEWMRIFVPRDTRGAFYWISHALLWTNVVFYITMMISGSLSCTPFERLWDPTVPGTCRNRQAYDVATGSFSLVSDIFILLLPQRVIWKLRLRRQKKIGIAVIFAVGLFACIATAFRLAASVRYLTSQDRTYGICSVALWAAAELTCAILIFSVPRIPKAIKDSPPAVKKVVAYMSGSRLVSNRSEDVGNAAWPTSRSGRPNGNTYNLINESSGPHRNLGSSKGQSLELGHLPQGDNDLVERVQPQTVIIRTTHFTTSEEYENGSDLGMQDMLTPWNQQRV
ncbi:hypothetical protein DL764_006201 [Monosporascus ibericus]|uniref:Rhodopsin domain-containing protein n=1 Tax=Monosporascus ibericus TaxID=155417 RepID=A0A4V1XA60_9PEZI|nr:hypothetical protein DL764_006201 [Monosporascus ibericus]